MYSDVGGWYWPQLNIALPQVGAAVAQLFAGTGWATGQVTAVKNGIYTIKYEDGEEVKFGPAQLPDLKQAVFDGLPQIGTKIRKGGWALDPSLHPGHVVAVRRKRSGPVELDVQYQVSLTRTCCCHIHHHALLLLVVLWVGR